MKTVKQKQQTLQSIIDKAQTGGGGTIDAYTKAEADAKFETKSAAETTYLSKSDAASTYLSKSDAASAYLSKSDAASTYQAKADMTNYLEEETGEYFVVNGIRIYVSATEPTGNIPDGSIGFGW